MVVFETGLILGIGGPVWKLVVKSLNWSSLVFWKMVGDPGNWLSSLEIGWHVRKLVGEFGYWSSSLDISGRVWKLVVESCVGGDLLQPPTIWFLACVVGRVAGINGDIPCIGVQTVNVCD